MKSFLRLYAWNIIGILIETAFIILFSLFFNYNDSISPNSDSLPESNSQAEYIFLSYYQNFHDLQIMMFLGNGLLMSYPRFYSWSGFCFNFILSVFTYQFTILTISFWRAVFNGWGVINLTIPLLIDGTFGIASILNVYGALFGKVSMSQLLVISFFFCILYSLNNALVLNVFKASDAGGGMFIYLFGSSFALACSLALSTCKSSNDSNNTSLNKNRDKPSYLSNLFSAFGSLLVWLSWPSFNGATLYGANKHRAFVNTSISLTSAFLVAILISPLFNQGKVNMEYTFSSSISGGVIICSTADLMRYPFGALVLGFMAGLIATLSLELLSPFLSSKKILQDTCGVLGTAFIPSLCGAVLAAILAGENYTEELFYLATFTPGAQQTNRNPITQMKFQFYALATSIGIGILGGILSGFISRCFWFKEEKEFIDTKFVFTIELEELVYSQYLPPFNY